jgi:hypothetical protein
MTANWRNFRESNHTSVVACVDEHAVDGPGVIGVPGRRQSTQENKKYNDVSFHNARSWHDARGDPALEPVLLKIPDKEFATTVSSAA